MFNLTSARARLNEACADLKREIQNVHTGSGYPDIKGEIKRTELDILMKYQMKMRRRLIILAKMAGYTKEEAAQGIRVDVEQINEVWDSPIPPQDLLNE